MINKFRFSLKITALTASLLAFYSGRAQSVTCTTPPQSITTTGATQTINDITAILASPTNAQGTRLNSGGVNGYYIGDGSGINPEQINFVLSEPVSSIIIIAQGLNYTAGLFQEKMVLTVNGVHHVVTPAEFVAPAPPPATAPNAALIDANGDVIGGPLGGSSFMLTITGAINTFTIALANDGTQGANGFIFDIRIPSTCAMVALPLKLTSFTASKAGANNLLQWTTATEENSKDFIVEHSTDGKTFMPLATLPAAGNSHTTQDYSYVHETPGSSSQYYRLKMTDMDGGYNYSPIKTVQNENSNLMKIFPNPTNGRPLQIQLPAGNTFSSLGIYDYTGREVLTSKSENGVDISSLHTGLYLARVLTTEGKVFRCELVKK